MKELVLFGIMVLFLLGLVILVNSVAENEAKVCRSSGKDWVQTSTYSFRCMPKN